jgi:formylglycine-generating enzyme required for sulfatase activity
VIRGGNFDNHAQNCRSAYRNNNRPDNRNNNIGFRLLLQLNGTPDGIY